MTSQMIENLRAIHELGLTHNDLKLENIVIGHKNPERFILIDFGLASRFR